MITRTQFALFMILLLVLTSTQVYSVFFKSAPELNAYVTNRSTVASECPEIPTPKPWSFKVPIPDTQTSVALKFPGDQTNWLPKDFQMKILRDQDGTATTVAVAQLQGIADFNLEVPPEVLWIEVQVGRGIPLTIWP